MVLAHRASYDKKTLARQVIPLAPGYRTALSSRPEFLHKLTKTPYKGKMFVMIVLIRHKMWRVYPMSWPVNFSHLNVSTLRCE